MTSVSNRFPNLFHRKPPLRPSYVTPQFFDDVANAYKTLQGIALNSITDVIRMVADKIIPLWIHPNVIIFHMRPGSLAIAISESKKCDTKMTNLWMLNKDTSLIRGAPRGTYGTLSDVCFTSLTNDLLGIATVTNNTQRIDGLTTPVVWIDSNLNTSKVASTFFRPKLWYESNPAEQLHDAPNKRQLKLLVECGGNACRPIFCTYRALYFLIAGMFSSWTTPPPSDVFENVILNITKPAFVRRATQHLRKYVIYGGVHKNYLLLHETSPVIPKHGEGVLITDPFFIAAIVYASAFYETDIKVTAPFYDEFYRKIPLIDMTNDEEEEEDSSTSESREIVLTAEEEDIVKFIARLRENTARTPPTPFKPPQKIKHSNQVRGRYSLFHMYNPNKPYLPNKIR